MHSDLSNPPQQRPRLLMIAYMCSPYYGSEPGAGWNRAIEESKYCDTWVICEGYQFRADIEKYLAEHGPIPGLHFVYVDTTKLERKVGLLPLINYLGYYYSYNLWHRRALKLSRQLHEEFKFDVVHQSTMCGFREPGYGWKLGIPFVWGPIGGTQNFPWRFWLMSGPKTVVFETFRTVANWFQLHTSLRVRRAARAAYALLSANTTTARHLLQAHGIPSTVISDVGIQVLKEPKKVAREAGPLRMLWCGLLAPRKALGVLLEALGQIKDDVDFSLSVLGKGECATKWRRRAKELGIDDRIQWLGHLPHDEAVKQFEQADVFVFTSLRDTTGTVVVEALAAGLPVVAFDHQGVGDVVNESCGIKVAVGNPKQAINDWARAVRRLAEDPALVEELSRGAYRRAHDYLWSTAGQRTAEILYRAAGFDERVVRHGTSSAARSSGEESIKAKSKFSHPHETEGQLVCVGQRRPAATAPASRPRTPILQRIRQTLGAFLPETPSR